MPITLRPYTATSGSGLEGQIAVIENPTALPLGLECVIGYNGLRMNNRRWEDTFVVTDIDGLMDAEIRDPRDVNPSYHGETAYPALYSGRPITITGYIRSYTLEKMRDMQEAMKLAFSDLREAPLIFYHKDPHRSFFVACRKSAPIAGREAQTGFEYKREFMISLRASNPRILRFHSNSVAATIQSSGGVTVINYGNFSAEPRITLTGPLTNPRIENSVSGVFMQFDGSIAAGQSITIDIAKHVIIDASGESQFDMLNIVSGWLELVSGEQFLNVTADSMDGNASIQVQWNDTWM